MAKTSSFLTAWLSVLLLALPALCLAQDTSMVRGLAATPEMVFTDGFESLKPGPGNTGPSDETLLTPSGSLIITQDGAVIENANITGSVTIRANNVTLRNFRIDGGGTFYGIRANEGYTGGLFEDGEITNIRSAGILGTGFIADRLEIHESGGDGLKVQGSGGPTVVMRSWIHHLGTNDGAHADGNQSRSGQDIQFIGNHCDMPITDPAPYKSNACMFLQTAEGPLDNVEIRDNWLNGGNYTIYCNGTNIRVIGNRFGREYRYGIRNNCSGPDTRWSGNVWDDTGEAIP